MDMALDQGFDIDSSPNADADLDSSTTSPDMFNTSPALVSLPVGQILGSVEDDIISFKGIPYAAPPTGALRFRAPVAPKPWTNTRDATSWPAPCPQLDRTHGTPMGDEDCLHLNVWTPKDSSNAPVIVFIHGGGNMFGSTSEEGSGVFTYEGVRLARRSKAVVVTLQYRLNTLGYMSLEELDNEAGHTSGNWGLRDQLFALTWIQDHIHLFGGDPDRVMLFGESGGASSVCGLVATPEASGLFHAAIMQSGGCGGQILSDVRNWSSAIVEGVGCSQATDTLACLRDVDAHELARVSSEGGTTSEGIVLTLAGPMIDRVLLPQSPLLMMNEGLHNQVPLVFGVNADETASPLFGIIGRTWSQTQYENYVRGIFGAQAESVLDVYSVGAGSEFRLPIQALIALTTDLQFICPSRRYAQAASRGQQAPVYRFLFDHALSSTEASLLGAFHGLELMYNFQHLGELEGYSASQDDLYVEEAMMSLWLDFAISNAPQSFDGVQWQPYEEATDPYLSITSPLAMKQGLRTERCDFLESLPRN